MIRIGGGARATTFNYIATDKADSNQLRDTSGSALVTNNALSLPATIGFTFRM